MKNQMVADVLYQIADLRDLKGEIFFKTRAYRIAAQTIEVLDEDVEDLVKQDRLREISGVGEALAKKIKELVETGELEYFKKLKKEIPEDLLKMLEIQGLGPKKVAAIYKNLGIKTISELKGKIVAAKKAAMKRPRCPSSEKYSILHNDQASGEPYSVAQCRPVQALSALGLVPLV